MSFEVGNKVKVSIDEIDYAGIIITYDNALYSVSVEGLGSVLPFEESDMELIPDGGSLPEVTSLDNGDVLTVVEGAWAKAAPSGNSGILVANIIDQQEEPYNTIINKTFAELAAADVVILRYVAAGDPLDPSSEFTVCCTIANVIANANSAFMVVYDNEIMIGQVGVSTFVASSVNDYPVAYGS